MRFFAVVIVFALPSAVFAWGEDGHHITWLIAQEYLSPTAKAGIKELREGSAIKDREIPNWADYIRSSAEYTRKYKNHPTWHYINIELKTKLEEVKPDEQMNDVIGGVEKFSKLVADVKAEKEARKEAFFFVAHFIGDLHQPLHCCNREDDKGGNMQPVKSFRGKDEDKLNLHKVWDTNLVLAEMGDLKADDFAKRLIAEIKADERKEWAKGNVRDWVWDSHVIGTKTVYFFTDKTELPPRDKPPVELTDENYIAAKRPIVREQLKKAGVRMAKALNECFPEKP